MSKTPISERERQFVSELNTAAERILMLGDHRIYSVIIDSTGLFANYFDLRHAGSAYLLWAGIGDLLDSPWGPASEEACDWMARRAAGAWLETDREFYEPIEEYFESWLAQLRSFVWPPPPGEFAS